METKYLSYEEQFKNILNDEEIQRIKEPELRKIRWDFWLKRTETFLDEAGIPDSKIDAVWAHIAAQEQEALKAYCERHNLKFKTGE